MTGHIFKILITILFLLPFTAQAETIKEHLPLGRKAWAAFECANIVGYAQDAQEQTRLFNIGYKIGTDFLEAIKHIEVQPSDINDEKDFFLAALSIPNTDFALGRIYERASLDFTFPTNAGLEGLRKKARDEFSQKNCSLIEK